MKKVNLLKVGLTTIAMMVLSACGGGGGGDTPTTASTNTTTGTNATTGNQQTGNQQAGNQQTGNQQPGNQGGGTADNGLGDELRNLAALITNTNNELKKSENDKNKLLDKIAELENKLKTPASDPEKEKLTQDLKDTKDLLADLTNKFNGLTEKLTQAEREKQEKEQKQQEENNNKQNAANNSPWVAETPVNIGKSHVGYLHTKKNQSDLDVLGNGSTKFDSIGNTALLMTEEPDKALDTLVIANSKDRYYYLEDLDLDQAELDNTGEDFAYEGLTNKVPLKKAYLDKDGREGRDPSDPMMNLTQIETHGNAKDAKALVYRDLQKIYLHKDQFVNTNTDTLMEVSLSSDGYLNDNPKVADLLDPKGTIFEIYGAKTKDSIFKKEDGTSVENLPLEDETLKYVQYGRATSQMSGNSLESFIEGLKDNTWIVTYGQYDDPEKKGVENHYFARGTNNTTAEQVLDLSKYYGTNELVYNGHAVTYGVNHDYRNGDVKDKAVATALSNRDSVLPMLVSGSHVRANVNLDTKLVKGNVYNVWALLPADPDKVNLSAAGTQGRYKPVETNLVSFEGNLAENGNIAGAAKNLTNNEAAAGIFNATLFGPKAEEMGGVIVSKKPEESNWGVSFGAIIKNQKPTVSDTGPGVTKQDLPSVVSTSDQGNVANGK